MKKRFFFGRIPHGIYLSLPYIVLIILITVIGLMFFDFWFFIVLGSTTFIAGDVYFSQFVDYEKNCVKIPIIERSTDNEYVMLAVYFVGVFIAGFAAFLSSYFLTEFEPIIHNLTGISIISFFVSTLVAYEIKSGVSKRILTQQSPP